MAETKSHSEAFKLQLFFFHCKMRKRHHYFTTKDLRMFVAFHIQRAEMFWPGFPAHSSFGAEKICRFLLLPEKGETTKYT